MQHTRWCARLTTTGRRRSWRGLTCTSSASSARTRGSSLTRDTSGASRTEASSRLGLGSGASAAGGGQCEQRPGRAGAAGLRPILCLGPVCGCALLAAPPRSSPSCLVCQCVCGRGVGASEGQGCSLTRDVSRKPRAGGADDGEDGGWLAARYRCVGGSGGGWSFLAPSRHMPRWTTVLSYMTAAPVGGRSWADGRCGMRAPHVVSGNPPHRSPAARFV